MSKKKDKGRINPGERDEEATRAFDKRQQKEAAKIEMVYKLGQRKKGGKYTRPAPGASKATDTESALNTFKVQKMFDRDQKAGKGPGIDLISDRRLASKEGSMKTGGLTGGQKKLDKNKNNRIDAEDFKILRGQGKGAMKARLGSRVPPVIRPKPTAGGKPLTPKPIKPKPKPKMGGGMMKKYNKGGGADTGTMGEAKSKLATGIDAFKRRLKKEKLQAPKRGPMRPAKAMGGGMMKKPMQYNIGGFSSKQERKTAEKNIKGARRLEGLRSFLSDSPKINQPMRKERYMEGRKARHSAFKKKIGRAILKGASALNPISGGVSAAKKLMAGRSKKRDFQRGDYGDISVKKMGGGMMNKPMGYKSGTSVKVKCKLGRNKPTKMY